MAKKLNLVKRVQNTLAKFISGVNSMSLPDQFLKWGNKLMTPDWTDVTMSDKDHYTGYGYAAIRNRAAMIARTAINNVRTESSKNDFVHPYLEFINNATTFSPYKFWSDICTYLDLEGVYYLLVLRNVQDEKDQTTGKTKKRLGNPVGFKLLNPYNIRRIRKVGSLEIGGYIENRLGFIREIQPEMIIEIAELNPFDEDTPFALTDAAKESQFTIKTAGDYTRHSLRNNINAPGILATDIMLDDLQFKNFVNRVKQHTKGEPIFANGSGAIKWEGMQIELSKAALKEVNEMNREQLFSVSGLSKTMLGIEQSGTTRETSRVQKEIFMEGHVLPRIQLIIDALNQDYKNRTPSADKNALIVVDNPLGVDLDASTKEVDLEKKKYELFSTLINRGVDPAAASSFVEGESDVDTLNIKPVVIDTTPKDKTTEQDNKIVIANEVYEKVKQARSDMITAQQGSLKNAVVSVDTELVSTMLNNLKKMNTKRTNAATDVKVGDEWDMLSLSKRKSLIKELEIIFETFYTSVMQIQGPQVMVDRLKEFQISGTFSLDKDVKDLIKTTSKLVSESHVKTVSDDIFKAASDAALQGKPLVDIENLLTEKFSSQVTQVRATAVARTETNRAFTLTQYEADKQLVEQNNLQGKTFKQWMTHSGNPCEFCKALEKEGKIPFNQNFRNMGDAIEVDGKELKVSYSSLQAGNAHPNCSCSYEISFEGL